LIPARTHTDAIAMEQASSQPAVLVIATEGEWASRSLESVLVNEGYAVIRALDGRDALACARRIEPDAMILDAHLSVIDGIDVCRQLRDDPGFDAATPIIITGAAPASRAMRTSAFAAGAWDFCTQPIDTDSLLLELPTFMRAKRAVAAAQARSFLDESTGVLSHIGIERWAEQLAARASRNHEPLACIVLMPSVKTADGGETRAEVTASVLSFLELSRDCFRRSDIVGRMRDGRLALLAPDTDAVGVHGLLTRLRNDIETRTTLVGGIPKRTDFRAGYWAVGDFASAPLEPAELLKRASRALDHANLSSHDNLAIGFDQIPVS
jgi:DNA-binding response OmpR family regulator